jgi:predicted Ser/Thr protein kinase
MNAESTKPSDPDRRCSKCGATMTVHTLRGLCPNCLALFAFASNAEAAATVRIEGPAAALAATLRYIGDYELQEEIGRGGMGVVFRARQAGLNRTVAVKMILAGQYAGPEERLRFQREAEAAAQLQHPNIVAIHEVGEHEGRSYFSMDFIEGKNLSAVLKEGKLPPAKAAALLKTLAGAVHFAHQRGTLHRDLKPQNILVGSDGQPHILDFGLARPVEREAGLTRTGDVMGSPSYMPPEQAMGRIGDIGPASDVYALGAILYETITGSPPFTGGTAIDVLTQVINQDPAPLRKHNPNVPADLETICLKCLEKRPERRYHSARALAEELERFLNFEPILARPASRLRKGWSWAQRNPWVFAAGFGLAAMALACVAYGLWEKTRVLNWRLEAGKSAALPARDAFFGLDSIFRPQQPTRQAQPGRAESPALLFFLVAPAIFSLLYFVGRIFRSGHRRHVESGAAIPVWPLLCHAAAGTAGATVGMGYLLLQIRSWMWQASSAPFLVLEIPALFCALILFWVGFRTVWEAVGIHETSRYRGLVNKALDQQWAGEGRRRRAFKWIGLIWWLYALALGVIFTSGSNFEARKRDLFAAISGMLLSTGGTVLAVWTIHNRRRLFTFVCVPLTLAAYGFAFVALTAGNDTVAILLLLYLFGAGQALVISPLFLNQKQSATGELRRFPVRPWLDILFGLMFAAGLFALLHLVENWRGKAAWENRKSALEAKGAKLDWAAYIPPPIPDDQNIFKAPRMEEWFTHGKSDKTYSGQLGELLNASAPWSGGNASAHFLPLAEIRILPLTTHPMFAPGEADLILRSTGQSLTVFTQSNSASPASAAIDTNSEVVALEFDKAPLHDAIKALALQAKLNIQFDPAIDSAILNTLVTAKWRRSTTQALSALLDNNGLRCVDDPVSRIKRIVRKDWPGFVPSTHPTVVTNGEVVDMVAFDSVPLRDAINALATQMSLKLQFDPATVNTLNATVTAKWRHISAEQALWALLDNYGLSLRNTPPDSKTWTVGAKDLNARPAYDAPGDVHAALKKVMDQTLGPTMIDTLGRLVPQRRVDQTRPARIILLCDRPPTTNEMEALFRDCVDKNGYYYNTVQVEATASDSMSVTANCVGSAGDYVTWSENCEPQLETIRQALRRPYMRLDIDYGNPMNLLSQNWVPVRILSQMMGSTAQAYMLRGDPENALRQLTLVHDLRRIMRNPPDGPPEYLVSAMIDSAVAGLYVSTIQCGLLAQVWRDPQLAALEKQLAEIDLPTRVERSFRLEQMFMPRMIDITPRSEMTKLAIQARYEPEPSKTWDWNRFRRNVFFRLAPQGWLDQNKADIIEAFQPTIDAFDPSTHVMQPRLADERASELDKLDSDFAPYTIFRAMAVPKFDRSLQSTAKNQTLVNQARIVCALERFRLAHDDYPKSLDALIPQYLDRIPKDLIGGQTPVYQRGANGGFQLSSSGWKAEERWSWPPQ